VAVQYQFGEVQPVVATVATAQAVTTGDLVAMSSGTLTRAEDETWDTNEATTRANFVAKFLGVSMQTKAANIARPYGNSKDNAIVVGTGPMVVEFNAALATYALGALVGPAKATGNALLSQTVKGVSTEAEAIGRVAEATGANATKVKVRILSVLQPAARQS
jgi:hypothetical protein